MYINTLIKHMNAYTMTFLNMFIIFKLIELMG